MTEDEIIETVAKAIFTSRMLGGPMGVTIAFFPPESLAAAVALIWERDEPGDEEKRDQFRCDAKAAIDMLDICRSTEITRSEPPQ